MYRLRFTILFCLFGLLSLAAAEATYLKVSARNGDGVYSMLRRYELLDEYCNVLQFYKLNKLKKDAKLLSGRKYYIPVLIYKYDGNSIRSSIGNNDWDRAVGIQKYNEKLLAKNLRKSSYRDSKLLWVPFSAIYCGSSNSSPNVIASTSNQKDQAKHVVHKNTVNNDGPDKEVKKAGTPNGKPKSSVPPKKNIKTHTIFGSKYGQYEEVDQSLKDKVYYIVSGHGGPDPGAMCDDCPQTLCEDEYAYDVSLRLARNLMQHGAKVEIIIHDNNDGIRDEQFLKCDQDERCNGKPLPLNQRKRLQQRVYRINSLYKKYKNKGYKEHVVIAIHVDAAGQGKRKDVFFYHHKKSKTGKALATNIHKTFEAKYKRFQKGRGYKGTVKSRGLYVINNTTPPIVFIELANIKNPNDQQRIVKNTNRQALANWIFEGLVRKAK